MSIPRRGNWSGVRGVNSFKRLLGVELFAGAGGMSLGAKWANIDVKVAVEIKPSACLTFARNHPKTRLFAQDIRSVTEIDLPKRNVPLVVFGGPPCQGFATSNQRTRSRTNPTNWLFLEFLRVVDLLGPEWVVFENVAGIVHTERGYFVRHLERHLKSRGYPLSRNKDREFDVKFNGGHLERCCVRVPH